MSSLDVQLSGVVHRLNTISKRLIKWNKEQLNISILINKHARLQEQVRPSLAEHE